MLIMSLCSHINSFQVRVVLGLRNHKWQDRHTTFARAVDDLGDQFRPAMCTNWLVYIKKANGEAASAASSCEDEGTSVKFGRGGR